jgi:tol-pal system protein YbgF
MTFNQFALAFTLAIAATPAATQTLPDLDKRVTRLEREVTRVSRRVLPKGEQTLIEPEIGPQIAPAAPPPPLPASAASVSDLGERVSAIERRQREITAQIEEQGNRLRQVEERLAKFQPDAEARLGKLEAASAPPAQPPAAQADAPPPAPAPDAAAKSRTRSGKPRAVVPAPDAAADNETPTTDEAASPIVSTPELRYKAAYKFVEARDWAKAAPALQAFVDQYPKNKLASNARYWIGRTQFKQMRYDAAARTHFDNYKSDPKGERAQESLFWVGQSLMQLKKAKEACQVYELAGKVYADTLKPELKPQFAAARAKAGCS